MTILLALLVTGGSLVGLKHLGSSMRAYKTMKVG